MPEATSIAIERTDSNGSLASINNDNKEVTTNNNSNGVIANKRKKLACVECRQQKSKCDAYVRSPNPCTRCTKRGLDCVLQRDFRRTYKRARNQAIEQKLKELAETLESASSDDVIKKLKEEQLQLLDESNFTKDKLKKSSKLSAVASPNSHSGAESSQFQHIYKKSYSASPTGLNRDIDDSFPADDLYVKMTDEQLQCSPKSIAEITISSEDIRSLFEEYATKYHPFLPVVNLKRNVEEIYSLSPSLFWVIILIGLRRKPDPQNIKVRLAGLVKSILAEITISPIIRYNPTPEDDPILNVASVYSVQAFLLYTYWPPLTSSLSADTSWNTIGTAMFQALRVGLNSANFSKEYGVINDDLTFEKINTWITCNIVSQTIASSFGFPAYVSFDYSVIGSTKLNENNNIIGNNKIPSCLRQMAQIAYFENQIVKTMNSNLSNEIGLVDIEESQPLLLVLTEQLNQLDVKLKRDNIDDIRKFLLLVSKVHLLTYHFTGSKEQQHMLEAIKTSASSFEFERKRGLVRVYNAAVELLVHTDRMWKKDPTIVKYFPGVFVLHIWQTACIVCKLLHSSISHILDEQRGKYAYQKTILIAYNASAMKHDMAYRASGIMRSVWSLFENLFEDWKISKKEKPNETEPDFNLDLIVNSRMSVSVFFDCLYILRKRCGMAKLKRTGKEPLEYEGEEEDLETDKKRILDVRNPEKNARRIMETIPLDPNPIGVSDNSPIPISVSLSSNNSHTSNTVSNESLVIGQEQTESPVPIPNTINKTDVVSNKILDSFTTLDNALTTNMTDINATGTAQPITMLQKNRSLPHNLNGIALNESNLKTAQTFVPDLATMSYMQDTISQHSNDSSNSILKTWDNWESEMVWKDVDSLMNDFAFNPNS